MLIAGNSWSQSGLMIQGISPDLHLAHTVATKETWASIARLYNITSKEIAVYNASATDKPLTVGKQIRIPLKSSNFTQDGAKGANEVFVPLFHIVQPKEWMYRISVNHNKVPIETLEKWNNISRDNAVAGTKLIVGYLKVKQAESALANKSNNSISTAPAVSKEVVTKGDNENSNKETIKKAEPKVKEEKPKSEIVKQNVPVPVKEQPKSEVVEDNKPANNVNFKGGYFKTQYDASGKSAAGVSGIFKSTSGWNDGKYYALMNNVPVGTIVKINVPSSNKNIYAKVLGQLPDMKESSGLTIRISDAAATELGAGNSKFTVDVKY